MAYTDGTREVLLVLDNERPPQYDSPNDATVKPPEYSSEKYSSENHDDMPAALVHVQVSGDPRIADEAYLGTDISFLLSFLMSFFFHMIGFLLAFCISTTLAGRYGAMSGFGLSLVKVAAFFYHIRSSASGTQNSTEDVGAQFYFSDLELSDKPENVSVSSPENSITFVYEERHCNRGSSDMAVIIVMAATGILMCLYFMLAYFRAKAMVLRARVI
eukprot:gene4829-8676_t